MSASGRNDGSGGEAAEGAGRGPAWHEFLLPSPSNEDRMEGLPK